jgi:hypothetical protein
MSRIRQCLAIEKKESTEVEIEELAKDWARADDDGFAGRIEYIAIRPYSSLRDRPSAPKNTTLVK